MTSEGKPEFAPVIPGSAEWFGAVRQQAERIGSHLLAHELNAAGGAPFYVIFESEYPTTLGATVFGYQHRCVDWVARGAIQGRWTGRGPAVVINDILARESCPTGWGMMNRLLGILIHELSHVATTLPVVPVGEPAAISVSYLELQAERPFDAIRPKSLPPWHDHEAEFIRVVIHAVHRARDGFPACLPILPDHVFNSPGYGLSPMAQYVAAIGDEPERMKRVPLSFLSIVDPPAEFSDLFASDAARWGGRLDASPTVPHQERKTMTKRPTQNHRSSGNPDDSGNPELFEDFETFAETDGDEVEADGGINGRGGSLPPIMAIPVPQADILATQREAVDVLDDLERETEELSKSRTSRFAALVNVLADGVSPDPQTLRSVLAECEKTPSELRQAVELAKSRRELVRIVATQEQIEADLEKSRQELQAEASRWEGLAAEHNRIVAEAAQRLRSAETRLNAVIDARAKLQKTAPAGVIAEIREVDRKIQEIGAEASRTRTALREKRDHARSSRAHADQLTSTVRRDEWISQAEREESRVAALEAELADLDQQIERLNSRHSELVAISLAP